MKKISYLILIAIYGIILSLFTFRVAGAFFSDTADSTTNTFAAAAEFPTATPTPTGTETPPTVNPGDVVINEVFAVGDNDVEWVELHNKTGSPINVSGWDITDNITSDSLPTVPPIPAGGYGVVIASGSSVIVPAGAVQIQLSNSAIGNGLANGGDRVSIAATNVGTVDAMSYGTDTAFFNPAATTPTAGNSLKRSPNGTDTGVASDWILDATPSIGTSND